MMKRYVLAVALLVLPLMATPARASGSIGFNFSFSPCFPFVNIGLLCGGCGPCGGCCGCGSGGCGMGPWYSYWPLEAHFQTPAMPDYPYWPTMGSMGHGGYTPPYWGH
jgi:hypothetical protein